MAGKAIVENRDTGNFGDGFFEQLQPLTAQFGAKVCNASDVAAGRASLSTRPASTGSPPAPTITMGIGMVEFLAGRTHILLPPATTMISTQTYELRDKLGGPDRSSPPHIGTRSRYSVLQWIQARAEAAGSPRNGWTHWLGRATIDILLAELSSAAALPWGGRAQRAWRTECSQRLFSFSLFSRLPPHAYRITLLPLDHIDWNCCQSVLRC